jgi:hypothetical protein
MQQLSKNERLLCKFYKQLSEGDRETLLSFAEFLNSRDGVSGSIDVMKKPSLQLPVLIKATENESVVKGIKRLKSSYFMIEDENLLHEISALMSEHIMKGVSAEDIILKIEAVFDKFYQQYQQDFAKEHQGAE